MKQILLFLFLLCHILFVNGEDETIDEFLQRSIPSVRNKRFVNSQEYLSEDDVASYLVRIVRRDPVKNVNTTLCSGSIIRSDLVLTSGGCLHEKFESFDKEQKLVPMWQLEVVAGEYDTAAEDGNEQWRSIYRIYVHPEALMSDYRRMWSNDIAIIQVYPAFEFDDYVNKVDLWLSNFATNYTEYYTAIKASGYGNSGSRKTVQYGDRFETFYNYSQTIPQYQYYAFDSKHNGICRRDFKKLTDFEHVMATASPNDVEHPYESLTYWYMYMPIVSAKRCFYTGTSELSAYLPSEGDAGGPITWHSKTNNKEYQVFLTPSMPPEKASFETDINYPVWGEFLANYREFIGMVFAEPAGSSTSFNAKKTIKSVTKSADLSYLGTFQYYATINVPEGKRALVNVTVTGENVVNAMRTGWMYFRRSSDKTVLMHVRGEHITKTSGLDVTAASDGSQASRWGCVLPSTGASTTAAPTSPGTTTGASTGPSAGSSGSNGPSVSSTSPNGGTGSSGAGGSGSPSPTTATGSSGSAASSSAEVTSTEAPTPSEAPTTLEPTTSIPTTAPVYSCNTDLTGSEGAPETSYSRVFHTYWPVQEISASGSVDVDLTFVKTRDASDRGSLTVKIDYEYIDNEVSDDEEDVQCDDGYRMCDDKLICTAQENVCDLDKDCVDGHDETQWCLHQPCRSSEFRCSTGECLRLEKLCNGFCDCLDTEICEDETILCQNNKFGKEKVKALGQQANSALSSRPALFIYFVFGFVLLFINYDAFCNAFFTELY